MKKKLNHGSHRILQISCSVHTDFSTNSFFLFPKILGKGGLPVVWKAALTVIEITRVIVADTRVYSKLEYLKITSLYSSLVLSKHTLVTQFEDISNYGGSLDADNEFKYEDSPLGQQLVQGLPGHAEIRNFTSYISSQPIALVLDCTCTMHQIASLYHQKDPLDSITFSNARYAHLIINSIILMTHFDS